MWSYVKDELPGLLASDDAFSSLDTGNCSIFGHSMGGHGEAAGTAMRQAGRPSCLVDSQKELTVAAHL
jgi:S-formylglutathione hydrolase FrmB